MASVIVVVIIFVLLALAILFICQNGGWQGGCGGNCAGCHNKCAEGEKKKKYSTCKGFPRGESLFQMALISHLVFLSGFRVSTPLCLMPGLFSCCQGCTIHQNRVYYLYLYFGGGSAHESR